ncbi:macoilin-2 isoform X1 [Bradysia coprophila]|uniref:macoilin-2 isoform X1 n=1 Tax=Bradysia coprophila TaxID=38358 RepID=UPI00187D9657|nr:macoilin-2 isoform X1 [Bradysia coprophila]
MKRRNADCGKLRRPVKRNSKIAEGMYGSNTLLYIKFLVLWAIVITCDYMLEFRFEFLWPFWLLLRSVHDSFKYKGLAFSVMFVCIAITSDLVCLFFIPVHWLFFAASTYVWVQYGREVWHSDKGICLPTIFLWMLFVYLEAAIRWKDSRHMPHLDLCRPFAAHCIGYPVTTLGFGFKSYVGYRIRQRKQREVAKENEFYMQLLQQALPQEDAADDTTQADFSVDLQKELSITTASSANNSFSNHHKNAQNSSKTLNLSGMSNGSAVVHVSTPNGVQQNSHKNSHRRSLDKDRGDRGGGGGGDTPNNSGRALSSDSNAMSSKMSYHQNHSYKESNKSSNSDNKSDRGEKETISYRNKEQFDKEKQNCGYDLQNSVTKSVEFKTSVNGKHASGTDSPHSKNDGSKIHNSNNSLNHMDYSVDSEKSSISLQSNASTLSSNKPHLNGGIVNYDHEINNETTTEVTEKIKGRKNRIKQKDVTSIPKDNHHNNSSSSSATAAPAAGGQNDIAENLTSSNTQQTQPTVPQICESCVRLESEVKKIKSDVSHYKQVENELKQKIESNSNAKSSLHAKQKENDELDKKLQELLSTRQIDRQSIQNCERRITEERRQRQTLESQLNSERKQRKLVEEKLRTECGEACKQRKLQLEAECKQLRRELLLSDDCKKSIEQQNRNYEQELRQYEAKFHNREGREVLITALQSMQEKNSTLEKNLSAETRVKLDLFSALGEAKRQLEIRDNMIRSKDKEVIELKAKIAQLLAVMPSVPSESFCLPPCSSTGSSMLRLNDSPSLQGPSSPMSHKRLGGSPLISQLQSLGVFTSSSSNQALSQSSVVVPHSGGQSALMNQGQNNNSASNLDPNATVYTPKNLVNGTEA